MKIIGFILLLITGIVQSERQKIPSIMVESLEGKKVNTNTFHNDGKPFIVVFWSTWCSPCKRELHTIHEVYDDWVKETGIKVITVSIDDVRNKHKVAPYVKSKEWKYEMYIDLNKEFSNAMNLENPPKTFLCNGKGEIVWIQHGYSVGDEEKLLEQIIKITH